MCAINHALTGTVIGLTVGEPVLALPLAVASHFICDMIPHYGSRLRGNRAIRAKSFRSMLIVDTLLCIGLVGVLVIGQPASWRLAILCAFFAAAPDFLSFNRYRHVLRRQQWRPGAVTKFASTIQWFERPIGGVVEAAWFVAAAVLILPFFR